jgi:hypothetical protein
VAPDLRDRGLNRDVRVTTGALQHELLQSPASAPLISCPASACWTFGSLSAMPPLNFRPVGWVVLAAARTHAATAAGSGNSQPHDGLLVRVLQPGRPSPWAWCKPSPP